MNQTLQLRYAHADHTRVLRDVRRNRLSEIIWNQVYYVGFRISTGEVDRYRHALLLADNYDALLDGIAGEFNAIREQSSATSFGTIRLVFMRNLMTLDPDVMASAECQNITTEIRDELSRQNDSQYLVFGMVGEHKICLIKVAVGDALMAIHQARSASMGKFKAEFTPLEVCQAHPVTAECMPCSMPPQSESSPWSVANPQVAVVGTEAQTMSARSRSSLPGLKCGTYLAGTKTTVPVFGLRPLRAGRWLISKQPNPRTSTRPHLASVRDIPSRMVRTTSSTSLGVSCG